MINKILVIDCLSDYRLNVTGHLISEGYLVATQKPEEYSGLGNVLPDLIMLDANCEGRPTLDMAKRIVEDIAKSGKPISMLVYSRAKNMVLAGAFQNEMAQIPGKHDYMIKNYKNLDNIVESVKAMG